jgi:hypothetical protein
LKACTEAYPEELNVSISLAKKKGEGVAVA